MRKWSCNLQQTKDELRKLFLAKRRAVAIQHRTLAGEAAKQILLTNPLFYTSQHIACYLGQPDEFDCHPIIQEVCKHGKTCYLPIVSSQNKSLQFVAYRPGDALRLNRYKIEEPQSNNQFAIENLDLVIVPLVAFDEEGHRIGMGGGYYDRTFKFTHQKNATRPFLLGLGYEIQRTPVMPFESWDVRLGGVLTEEGLYLIS